jgi:DNA-binding NarL/FixJ family response regulator
LLGALMADASARVGIVEDDEALRSYLEDVITATDGLEIAFSEGTLADARLTSAQGKLDLCLIDLNLPDGHGFDLIQFIKTTTAAKCLILTVLADRTSVTAAIKAGADGYLLKDTPAELLRANIFRTLLGETPISPQAATFLLELWRGSNAAVVPGQTGEGISTREVEVLRLFSRGLSYRETAYALGLSQYTIGDYVKSIYRKLGVHSRTEAIFEARQVGLIAPLD